MPYVVTLYRQGNEEQSLADILKAATTISTALSQEPELQAFLKIPFIPFEEKISILETLLPRKQVLPLFLAFLTLLGQNRKLSFLHPILIKFLEYADHKSGKEHIRVVSAFALTKATTQALHKTIEAQLQKPIELSVDIDRSLIGGIVIHYYHHEIDLSLKNTILSLKSALKELYA